MPHTTPVMITVHGPRPLLGLALGQASASSDRSSSSTGAGAAAAKPFRHPHGGMERGVGVVAIGVAPVQPLVQVVDVGEQPEFEDDQLAVTSPGVLPESQAVQVAQGFQQGSVQACQLVVGQSQVEVRERAYGRQQPLVELPQAVVGQAEALEARAGRAAPTATRR
ncbi:hypothetical protein CRUP_006788 [Coryphaenoides rupestris]|nr:hypothetical protein CRUP_006788 [Coryphaenoides rupestris]